MRRLDVKTRPCECEDCCEKLTHHPRVEVCWCGGDRGLHVKRGERTFLRPFRNHRYGRHDLLPERM